MAIHIVSKTSPHPPSHFTHRVPGFTPPTKQFPLYAIYLIQDAFVISIVTYSVTVSLVQTFAREHQYTFDNNQVCVHSEQQKGLLGIAHKLKAKLMAPRSQMNSFCVLTKHATLTTSV